VTNYKLLTKQTCLLLISWFLLTFLVGNAYKGVLFTLLTKPSVPVVLNTLQQVIDSNISVVSTHGIVADSFVRYPTFSAESEVQRILKTLPNQADAALVNNYTLNSYKKLKDRTNLALVNISNLFISMKTGNEVQASHLRSKNHTISEKVMILNPEDDVKLLKQLYRIFATNIVVLGDKLSLLTEQKQLTVRRNSFLTSFLPILSGLIESGIYQRWEYFEKVLSTHQVYWATRRELAQGSSDKFSLKDNILAYLLFKPYTDRHSLESEQPITLKFFAVFARLFGYCIAFCSIVFVVEKLSRIELVKLYTVTLNKIEKLYHAFIHKCFSTWLQACKLWVLAASICMSWMHKKLLLLLDQLNGIIE